MVFPKIVHLVKIYTIEQVMGVFVLIAQEIVEDQIVKVVNWDSIDYPIVKANVCLVDVILSVRKST